MSTKAKQSERNNSKQQSVNATICGRAVMLAVTGVAVLSVLGMILIEHGGVLIFLASILVLLCCGALTIALARIIGLLKAIRDELITIKDRADTGALDDIATDLTAMRTQMRKGVFGLLGI